MPRLGLASLTAIAAITALKVTRPTLMDAIEKMRAERCAHKTSEQGTYPRCFEFMKEHCNPGPDGIMDGSPGERTTGDGSCKDFFNRDHGAPGVTAYKHWETVHENIKGVHPIPDNLVAFKIWHAGDDPTEGQYLIDGTYEGYTRYVQHNGDTECVHVNDYWLLFRNGEVCYGVKSDKRTPPPTGWIQAPDSPCNSLPLPRFHYGRGAGRPHKGDIVTIVRAKTWDHRRFLKRSGEITSDMHDETPFQIASLGGEWFYEEEVVMGHEFPCTRFDGKWLNDMDGWEKEEDIADASIDNWDFRVSDDCETCYMSHHGYKLTGHLSVGGLYINWNNGYNWTKFVGGDVVHRVVNMTTGDLKLQGPIPYGFSDILAKGISAATIGTRPMDVKLEDVHRLTDDNMVIVQFKAPYEAVLDVQKQSADMHSKLANGVLRKFLMIRSKYQHISEQNAEFSAH